MRKYSLIYISNYISSFPLKVCGQYQTLLPRNLFGPQADVTILHKRRSQRTTFTLVWQNFGKPSNGAYSFVLGIKWKLRMSRFRICVMPPWHPPAFCAIEDGVQDGRQFNRSGITTTWDIISHMVVNHSYRYLCLLTKWESKSVQLQMHAFSNTAHHVRWRDKFLGINIFI
jgi:hypothetical protein